MVPPVESSDMGRKAAYGVLIAISLGLTAGRILVVNNGTAKIEASRIDQKMREFTKQLDSKKRTAEERERLLEARQRELNEKLRLQTPFLSSNDRSRWANVRALVELGTFEIDEVIQEPTWDTIDKVQHVGKDGEKHLYSSKPPLLATVVAGEYWLINKITGKTLGTHPFEIGRLLLLTINLPLFYLMFVLLARLIERYGQTSFGKIFAMAVATLGTLLTSFGNTLSNHLFGAVFVTIALYAGVRILWEGERRARYFVIAGLAAAFATANELPALSFLGLLGLALLIRTPKQTLVWGVPAVLLIAVAHFGTNYLAHGTLKPAYAYRHVKDGEDSWYHYTYFVRGVEKKSHWLNPQGIDKGEPDPNVYAFHVLFGHHGVFSLTPVWLLSLLGVGMWACGKYGTEKTQSTGKTSENPPLQSTEGIRARVASLSDRVGQVKQVTVKSEQSELKSSETQTAGKLERRVLALVTALLTILCLVFFIYLRPQEDRNYGGMSNGFRWLFWLIPLWVLTLLPAADWIGCRRWTRMVGYLFLALSVVSVMYSLENPWTQPWLARWFEAMGWVTFG